MQDDSGASADALPDDAVVVRGGLMLPADLEIGAQSHFDREGFYALSVFSLPGRTADEIAREVALPHSRIRESTVGRVRAAGYDVVATEGPPGHADVRLPDPPSEFDWQALDAIFDAPRQNPARMGVDDV